MSDDRLDRLRRMLAAAEGVPAVRLVHGQACSVMEQAAAARDFGLLDEAVAVVHAWERKGGQMLMNSGARLPGVNGKRWRSRGQMTDQQFERALRKTQRWRRSRASEPDTVGRPSSPETGHARTLVSGWYRDELGFPTRHVVGVCPERFERMAGSGRDPDKVAAQLLAEVLERPA